jgi:eukaryotic-like serine/threonine-protein kinase
LPPGALSDEQARKRFRKEAITLSLLNHPNLAVVYDFDSQAGIDFLAMEYVVGQTLAQKLASGPLPEKEVVSLGYQIAEGLEEAHEHSVVHRDLKPGNVMVTEKGRVKVLDFGLAKLLHRVTDEAVTVESLEQTQAGALAGTVPYMAPEQLKGEAADPRTDIYALGAVLYELATGRRQFPERQTAQLIASILTETPRPPRQLNGLVSPALDQIILKALDKEPARRYQSAKELGIALQRLITPSQSFVAETVAARGAGWTRPRLRATIMTAVGLVLAAVGIALVGLWRSRAPAPVGARSVRSLAVLPLENLSGDPQQEYFADGMTEELITNLAKIGSVRVISRTSVMQYKGTRRRLPEIAEALHVDAVIEGSVLRSGSRVRITAQLIDATTDQHLWADSYERDIRDVLALQSEVAQAIASQIKVELNPQQKALLGRILPVNSDAYDYYLRGKSYLNHEARVDNETAIGLLERAVAIDPNFAAAYGELAKAYTSRLSFYTPEEKEWEQRASTAAEKALSLDSNSENAHIVRARLLWTRSNHFQHERALQEYRSALALNPNSGDGLDGLSSIYSHIGLLTEALQEAQKGVAIDPGNNHVRYELGQALLWHLKFNDAVSIFRILPKGFLSPVVGSQTAWALFKLGRQQEARAVNQECLKNNPEDSGGLLTSMQAVLSAAAGNERAADESIRRAQKDAKSFIVFHHTAYNIATAYALMNKPEPAIRWLQETADDGFPCYPLFEKDPSLDSLRTDPRFIELMTKLNQQWQHFRTLL